MKVKRWLTKLIAGLAIGTGAAIPGVSGAAIAVIFHVYEDLLDAINNFKKRFTWAMSILLPIVIGVGIAVCICIVLFSFCFEHLMFILICVFAGFLIGSFPGITDEVKNIRFQKKYIIFIIIGIVFVIVLGALSIISGVNNFGVSQAFETMPWWLYLLLVPAGAFAAVALLVPGLSGSLLLLILGFYRPLVDCTKTWAKELFGIGKAQSFAHTLPLFLMLACFAIGCLLGVIFISKLMHMLLDKYRVETFFAIIGFIVGSIVILFINYDIYNYYRVWNNQTLSDALNIHQLLPMYLEMIIGVVVLLITAILSYLLVKAQRKHQQVVKNIETNENESN